MSLRFYFSLFLHPKSTFLFGYLHSSVDCPQVVGKKVTGTSRLISLGSRGREILFFLEIMNEKSEKTDWLFWGSCDHPELITDQDDVVL